MPQQARVEAPVRKTRRRLFTKYVALFVAVVCIALVSNGVFDVLFYYQEHKVSLIRIQREQAEAAAAKVALSEVTYVPWGEWVQPTAFRKNVRDVLRFGAPIFWNAKLT